MMKSKLNRLVKTGLFICSMTVLSIIVAYTVSAAPTNDDYLLRVEVQDGKDTVNVSAPLSLIHTIYEVMPKEILQLCKELKLTPDDILTELQKLEGEDLVRIEGSETVRVWLDPVSADNQKDLGFFRVQVKDGEENIKVCVPRGLIQLAGKIVKRLDLVNRFVELPDEIKELTVIPEEKE